MDLKNRDLITIDDLTNSEIESIFSLSDEMSEKMPEQYGLCAGKIMATIFFEPSTRTRLSFESAMHRLGGSVISVADPKSTSFAKGESIADMARIISGYADIIVLRHPWEGAAQLMADYATVPVINAGDGGHQHPTQTLCDNCIMGRPEIRPHHTLADICAGKIRRDDIILSQSRPGSAG
jgi:aspartate carbamoyltransferase catalytic subunit